MCKGSTRIKSLLLALLLYACVTLAYADFEVEYSRITMGGGQSQGGQYEVNDSLTQTTSVTVQEGTQYKVTNIKKGDESTVVEDWKDY